MQKEENEFQFTMEDLCSFNLFDNQQDNKNMSMEELVSQFPKKHFFNVDGIILLTSVITDNFAFSKKEDIQKYWENIPVISVGQKIKNVPSLMIETDVLFTKLTNFLPFEIFSGVMDANVFSKRILSIFF